MKKHRLLKDLPFAKAGEILESRILDDGKEYIFWGEIKTEKIENFDDWFEEIKSSEIASFESRRAMSGIMCSRSTIMRNCSWDLILSAITFNVRYCSRSVDPEERPMLTAMVQRFFFLHKRYWHRIIKK